MNRCGSFPLLSAPHSLFSIWTNLKSSAHSTTFLSLHLSHSSFFNPSVAFPTSQLILQPFCCLHLRHSSFSNPSFASPTSQALHLRHVASRPCGLLACGMNTSLLYTTQTVRFRTEIPSWKIISLSLCRTLVRKSRYWGEMLLSPIHCCDVTKPPYLLSGELCTSPLHSNRLFVYTFCCRCRGQCLSVLRARHTDVVGDSSGRSYVTE